MNVLTAMAFREIHGSWLTPANLPDSPTTSGLAWPDDLFAAPFTVETRTDWRQVWAGPDLRTPEAAPEGEAFEAAHILFRAVAGDALSAARALARAEAILTLLVRRPERFAELARLCSECPSGIAEGRLGRISAPEVTPEFLQALRALAPGELCAGPVATPYGVHIVRLDAKRAAPDAVPGAAPGRE